MKSSLTSGIKSTMIAQKQLMKMTIKFCETTSKETEHEIKEERF